MGEHWIVQGLLIIIGGFIVYGWKNLVHRVADLETWRTTFSLGAEHKFGLLEKDVALILEKMKLSR